MKVHFSALSEAELSMIVGKLAGQHNVRLLHGQAWVGRPYTLTQPSVEHTNHVERRFGISTECRTEKGLQAFISNGDARTSHENPCISRTLAVLLKSYPSGYVTLDQPLD